MTVLEMVDLLASRLEDLDKRKFPDSAKLLALENAQLKIGNMLHDNYLTELQVIDTSQSIGSGYEDISDLTYKVLRGGEGIMNVKDSSGLYLTRINLSDIKKTENTFYVGSLRNPVYYIYKNRIYVLPTTISAIDVYYLKIPSPLTFQFTSDQADAGASTTKFDGAASEGLSASDDHYNNQVVYHQQANNIGYYTINDYTGSSLEFTIDQTASQNFVESQDFYFITNNFDQTNLTGVTCDLNVSLHDIMVTLAEAECWKLDNKLDRSNTALNSALNEMDVLNSRYEEAEGIGVDGRGL